MPTQKPPTDAPEHVRCKWWRQELMELTREQVAGLTGFSVSSIRDFETGGKEIDDAVRKRYRMACAAVTLGVEFDWLEARQVIVQAVEIRLLGESDVLPR